MTSVGYGDNIYMTRIEVLAGHGIVDPGLNPIVRHYSPNRQLNHLYKSFL
jgi:hypothetical protein